MLPTLVYQINVLWKLNSDLLYWSFNQLQQSSSIPDAVLWLISFAMADESTFVRKVLILEVLGIKLGFNLVAETKNSLLNP